MGAPTSSRRTGSWTPTTGPDVPPAWASASTVSRGHDSPWGERGSRTGGPLTHRSCTGICWRDPSTCEVESSSCPSGTHNFPHLPDAPRRRKGRGGEEDWEQKTTTYTNRTESLWSPNTSTSSGSLCSYCCGASRDKGSRATPRAFYVDICGLTGIS